jgi:hypothetical protein
MRRISPSRTKPTMSFIGEVQEACALTEWLEPSGSVIRSPSESDASGAESIKDTVSADSL